MMLVRKEQELEKYEDTWRLKKKKIKRLKKASQKLLFHLGLYVARENFHLKMSYWEK